MKKVVIFLLAILLVIPFSLAYIGTPGIDFVPNQLIVKFRPTANIQSNDQAKNFAQDLSPETISKSEKAFPVISKKNNIGLDRIYVIDFNSNVDLEKIITAYKKNPNIEYVEPNHYGQIQAVPNDPNYPDNLSTNQSGLRSLTPERGWDYTTGSPNVIIAELDVGVGNNSYNINISDLTNNIYINTKDPINGTDDDANNCTDDYYGCDVLSYTGNISDLSSSVANSHGTKIAGIIAGVTNNTFGIAGTCWNCKIMVIRILDTTINPRDVTSLTVYRGVIYAVNNNANIISLSSAFNSSDNLLNESVAYAKNNNVIYIASAGNQNNINPYIWPAANPDVIGVSGIYDDGSRWILGLSGTNYGPWVDVSAPAFKVISTLKNGNIGGDTSGTSFAAPFVAGEAGLILSRWPGLLKKQVEYIIKDAVDNISASNPGFQGLLGTGRINITKAMEFGCSDKTFLRSCSTTKPYYCDFDQNNIPILSINISICGWCQDTDGGINENITGNVTYFDTSGTQIINQDTCQNKNTLTEYYCLSNQSATAQITCPQGTQCSQGSCILNPTSGGSPFIFKRQKVTEILNSPSNQALEFLVPISRFLRFLIPTI